MSAGSVRAGSAFVEIGADPRKFFAALNRINKAMANMGRSLAGAGAKIGGIGVATLAPFAAAVRQGTAYQSTLLNIQASTGATAAELDKIKASSMAMSKELGIGPQAAAEAIKEMVKGGLTLDQVLGGAGKTAAEFSTVAEMAASEGAVVLSKAMNAFGVGSERAANALSAAADASATSIPEISQAFSQVSAVAASSNQSIEDLAAGLAVLANKGIVGSDAGTSVKTMLQRLKAPSDEAAEAMASVGLSIADLRDATSGKLLALPSLIGTLEKAFAGVDEITKDMAIKKIFGDDAIRAAEIFRATGKKSFEEVMQAMASALPVGEKYKVLTSGLAGAGETILAAMQRLAVAISDAVGPALMSALKPVLGFIDGLSALATKNKETLATIAKFGVAAVAIGGALTGLGLSLQVTAFGMGGLTKAAALLLSPLTMLASNVTLVGKSFALAMPHTIKMVASFGTAMSAASAFAVRIGASASAYAASLGVMAAATAARLGVVAATWAATGIASSAGFLSHIKAMITYYTGALAGVQAITISRAGATAAAWITSAAGADTFANAFSASMKTATASSSLAASTVNRSATLIAKATSSAASGVSMVAGPISVPFVAAGKAVSGFASDIASGLVLTYKSFAWWASGVTARMAQYTANLTGAVGKTIASTAAMGAAWVGSALRGVGAFVASSIAGLGSYLAAAATAVAGSVASAAAVAAAWLAPLAPFLALGAAIAGVGALVYSFRDQIGAAFSGVAGLVGQAADAIGGGLNQAAADGMIVLSDLATTATTTFNGIYAAISAGDLSGAMDVLWAGLMAGWLRGVEALMGYVDPWVATFQNVFTYAGTEIAVVWEQMWTGLSATANTIGAALTGAFDNIINGVLKAWDSLEAGILKSWNYIQSFFKKGFDLKKENEKVDSKMAARARKRELERPGVAGRMATAAAENEAAAGESQARVDAMRAGADATAQGRFDENASRAEARRAATMGAEATLNDLVRGQAETRARGQQADDLGANIANVGSLDGLRELADEFHTLKSMGRLTSEQEGKLAGALDAATERLMGEGATIDPAEKAQQGAGGAGVIGPSQAEVAGTFSSVALGGMAFGSSLDQKQLDALTQIARNTDPSNAGEVAA